MSVLEFVQFSPTVRERVMVASQLGREQTGLPSIPSADDVLGRSTKPVQNRGGRCGCNYHAEQEARIATCHSTFAHQSEGIRHRYACAPAHLFLREIRGE